MSSVSDSMINTRQIFQRSSPRGFDCYILDVGYCSVLQLMPTSDTRKNLHYPHELWAIIHTIIYRLCGQGILNDAVCDARVNE